MFNILHYFAVDVRSYLLVTNMRFLLLTLLCCWCAIISIGHKYEIVVLFSEMIKNLWTITSTLSVSDHNSPNAGDIASLTRDFIGKHSKLSYILLSLLDGTAH